jgi:uncharacterized membrane protein
MRGSIRAIVGFIIVFGAVGGMEHDPTGSLLVQTSVAVLGLCIMYSGVRAMNGGING